MDIRVGLSTTSLFPEKTAATFALAAELGYDGVEIMVSGLDAESTDPYAWQRLSATYHMPVLSVHAPTLLLTQQTWGWDAWGKLERAAEAAQQVDAGVVVVHPPFRWQRSYAHGFVDGIRELEQRTGIKFCVENMFPWRTPRGDVAAYLPGWDPTELAYDHLTLDLSHASTSRRDSLTLAKSWGERLAHVHLTDGSGTMNDEHLMPGYGDQHAAEVLDHLVTSGYTGHVVLEINTRKAGSKAQRRADLAESLDFTRRHLRQTS